MLDELAALVAIESPSASAAATRAAADAVDDLLAVRLGTRGTWVGAERGHLLWSGGGTPRVLLLGHVDTVWPLGTLERWPFDVADGRATGPGCFDMKAGLVQGIAALASLDDLDGAALLVTTDEEVGSPSSRELEPAEQVRVDIALRGLIAQVPGCSLELLGGVNRPPLDPASSAELFARAGRLAEALGLPPLEGVHVGGASDGNITAGLGIPTLDGLGAVGGGAHAEGEHVLVELMAPRSALVAALIRDLLARRP